MRRSREVSDQEKNAKAVTTVSDWWLTIHSHSHGSDEGILFLSSSTAVALASLSVRVSVEGSIVCGMMRLRRRDDNWDGDQRLTIVTK
jgi:hypothetical protein